MDIDAQAGIAVDSGRGWRDRSAAIKALGRSGNLNAVVPLEVALHDESKTVAVRAAVALGNLGSREAVPALSEAVTGDGRKDVRMTSAQALGKIGDPAGADALRQATSDRIEAVRSTATSALKKLERTAAAVVAANPEMADEEARTLAVEGRDRRAFNLPFILTGLIAATGVSYWTGGSEALGTVLPVVIAAAALVVGVNLAQRWWKNRER